MSISKRRLISLGFSILMCFNHLSVLSYAEEPADTQETTVQTETPEEVAVEATAEEEAVETEAAQESAEVIAESEITETETVEEYQAGTSDFRYSENTADGSVTITGYTGTDSDVVIPSEINGKTVTAVGERVFVSNSCRSVTIPDTVTSIGVAAFSECGSLETVTLPQGLTRIEAQVFYKCSSLQNITIPESVTEIGVAAFSGCSGLLTMVIPNGVTSIGNNAFKDCTYLQSIVIPDSVTSIGSSAFSSCISLQDITIPASVTIIGNEVFNTCSSLQSVTVPDGVTYIGLRVFSSCSALQSITIPESVTDIGDYAFRGCTSLSDVYYQGTQSQWDSITIGTDNDPLNTATIHTAGEDAVEFDYTVNEDDTITITGYTGTDTVVVIPGDIDGKTVTSIGDSAFAAHTTIQSITIPDGVTSIEDSAFFSCVNLQSIRISNTVTNIGNSVFGFCSNLQSIEIPESATSIGDNAFANCTNLSTLILPIGLTVLGENLIEECPELKTAGPVGSDANIQIGFFTEIPEIYRGLFVKLESIEIPYTVTSIAHYTFGECTNLQSITIPEGVTSIGSLAFAQCSSLQSITLPERLTSIGEFAFGSCSSLQDVVIPEGVTTIGDRAFSNCTNLSTLIIPASLEIIGRNVVSSCEKLKTAGPVGSGANIQFGSITELPGSYNSFFTYLESIDIPNTITSLGDSVFLNCTSLESVLIPESVTAIGNSAFSGCTGLQSITISEGVTSIGDYAFSGCADLQSIMIPESVTSIGREVFMDCTNLTTLIIPAYLETVGYNAVNNCQKLKTAGPVGSEANIQLGGITELPGSYNNFFTYLESIDIPNTVTSIGESVFINCTSLESVVIHESVTNIGFRAFMECTNLQSITIPVSVTGIGNMAFNGCTGLADVYYQGTRSQWNSVTIGTDNDPLNTAVIHTVDEFDYTVNEDDTITITCYTGTDTVVVIPSEINGMTVTRIENLDSVGEGVFGESLEAVTLPDTLTAIGDYAFRDCTNLRSITIPDNVTTIGSNAFSGCFGLQTMIVPAGLISTGGNAVNGCESLETAGPIGSNANIQFGGITEVTQAYGRLFKYVTSIELPAGITGIGANAFSATSLSEITIPEGVTFIGNNAFKNCTRLQSVTLPESLTSIGNWAFDTCTSLQSITIPDSVTSIGTAAFYMCTSLDSVTLSSSLTAIPESLFKACSSLQSIVVPDNVTTIGTEAFRGCTGLENITVPVSVTSISDKAFADCSNLSDVYYQGTRSQWNEIVIGTDNDPLNTAVIHTTGEEPNVFHVTFNANGGTFYEGTENTTTDNQLVQVTEGESVSEQIPELSLDGELPVGYTKDEETIVLTEDEVITFVPEKDTVFTAVWDQPVYTWEETEEGYTVTAYFENLPGNEESADAELIESVPATCETDGSKHYSVQFSNVLYTEQTKDVAVPAIGHDYGEAEYTWTETETGYTVTASAVCKHDESHILTETAEAGYQVITEPACETEGLGRYTAVFEDEHFTEQIKDVEIPASGHNYEFKEFVWSGDDETGYTAEGSYVCANDSDHKQTIAAEMTSETADPTCEEAGQTVYTAVIPAVSSADEQEHTETKTVVIEALGHDYGEAEYTWTETENGYTVTASAICRNDESHILTETATAAYEVITEPAYGKEGLGRYTAVFEDEHFTEQTKDIEIPAEERGTGLYLVDGTWQYYENGIFTEATGLVQRPDNKKWFYVEDGIYTKATGLTQRVDNKKWYYVQNGAYTKVTGVVRRIDNGKWFYVKDGVYTKATGLAQRPDNKQWYYVRNGAYYNKITGLVQRIDNGKWFYVENGVYKKVTGLVQRPDNKKWYYVANGAYTKATGLTQRVDNKKWYYVYNGAYTKWTGVTGRITDGKMFYVANGVYTNYTGTAKDAAGNTYKVTNGAAVRI